MKKGEVGYTFTKPETEECMSKPSKQKKDRVPTITEAQYAAYISALKTIGEHPPKQEESQDNGVKK